MAASGRCEDRYARDVTPDFSGVLLAGGKSSRMGCDKAFIEIEGVPLWQRQLQIIEQLSPRKIFIAAPMRSEWNGVRCTVNPDAQENSGPLGGLLAALRKSATPLLLALAIDLPRMTTDYLRGLLKLCEDGKGVVPISDRRFEPLAAFYPASSLRIAEQLLSSGCYALQDFAKQCLSEGLIVEAPVSSAEIALFLNVNTPTDLLAIKA
jgi:molybdopterin-guanine dinucleotide biosynthesis protein A